MQFLDHLKNVGFLIDERRYVDGRVRRLRSCNKNKVLETAHAKVAQVQKQYEDGIITDGERK